MPQERPSFFVRTLPRVRPLLSFRWGRIMNATARIVTSKTIPAQKRNMIEKILSLTAESWNDLFQVVSVAAAAVAFVALVGTALTGRRVSQRQAETIRNLDIKVAEQQERAAKAELALEEVMKR